MASRATTTALLTRIYDGTGSREVRAIAAEARADVETAANEEDVIRWAKAGMVAIRKAPGAEAWVVELAAGFLASMPQA